jgi:hypothetical protein
MKNILYIIVFVYCFNNECYSGNYQQFQFPTERLIYAYSQTEFISKVTDSNDQQKLTQISHYSCIDDNLLLNIVSDINFKCFPLEIKVKWSCKQIGNYNSEIRYVTVHEFPGFLMVFYNNNCAYSYIISTKPRTIGKADLITVDAQYSFAFDKPFYQSGKDIRRVSTSNKDDFQFSEPFIDILKPPINIGFNCLTGLYWNHISQPEFGPIYFQISEGQPLPGVPVMIDIEERGKVPQTYSFFSKNIIEELEAGIIEGKITKKFTKFPMKKTGSVEKIRTIEITLTFKSIK